MLTTPSMLRQDWLEQAGRALRKRFKDAGYTVPDEVRQSIGWPRGRHGKGRAIGQCWAREASSDQHAEIFISPELGHRGEGSLPGSIRIMGVMAHEYGHAVAGNKAGHYKPFQLVAAAVGLEGPPWTATGEGDDFTKWAKTVVKEIGTFPSGALSLDARKVQVGRMLKAECVEHNYIVRASRKTLERGLPLCPFCQCSMECSTLDEEEEEGE